MRAFDRDLIRGGHYGQRSCEPRLKGRTHGCTDQPLRREILLANPEPSTHGTKQTYDGRDGYVRLMPASGIPPAKRPSPIRGICALMQRSKIAAARSPRRR